MKKVYIFNAIAFICGIFLFWVFLSFIDVIIHNNAENPIYHFWNIFPLLF